MLLFSVFTVYCLRKETFRGIPGILDESSLGLATVQGSSPSLRENKHNKPLSVSYRLLEKIYLEFSTLWEKSEVS
jgi:hypothetical protein